MRYTACMVGRSETLPIKNFHSLKLYQQISVEFDENDNVAEVVDRLHGECKQMLEAQKQQQGLPATPAVVTAKVEFKTADQLANEQPADNSDGKYATNGGTPTGNGDGRKPKCKSDRSVDELIKQHNIRSLSYANYCAGTSKYRTTSGSVSIRTFRHRKSQRGLDEPSLYGGEHDARLG